MALSIEFRLNKKTIKDPKTGCWLWMGGNDGIPNKGYGRIRLNGIKYHVARISAHLYLGLDLKNQKLHALHKLNCPNKNCWNPEHLYVGTPKDNSQDSILTRSLRKRRRKHETDLQYAKRMSNELD